MFYNLIGSYLLTKFVHGCMVVLKSTNNIIVSLFLKSFAVENIKLKDNYIPCDIQLYSTHSFIYGINISQIN